MRSIRKIAATAVLLAAIVLLTGAAGARPVMQRWVAAAGGGETNSGSQVLRVTIGQSSAGLSGFGGATLCAGFWCRGASGTSLYLPLVLRQ